MQKAVCLQGKAMVDGRTLQAPIYCEHESLHTSTKSLSKEVSHRLHSNACTACHPCTRKVRNKSCSIVTRSACSDSLWSHSRCKPWSCEQALLAVDSPLSPLDTKPSGDSVQSDMSPSASEVSLSPKPALQQVSLSPIPEV